MLQFLQLRILLAKSISILLGKLSGLYIGVVGPMAHIGSIVGYNLLRLKVFKKLKDDNVL